MQWRDVLPDIPSNRANDLLRRLDFISVIAAMVNLSQGATVYCLQHCMQGVLAHVSSAPDEVGGLLLGRVFHVDRPRSQSADRLVLLTSPVPSEDFSNSRVSLRMGTEVWLRASDAALPPDIVVGWYHSHPGLGAFFSSTDLTTHKAFFCHDFSLGWVIDPVRSAQKLFRGPTARLYDHPLVVVGNELAVA